MFEEVTFGASIVAIFFVGLAIVGVAIKAMQYIVMWVG